MRYTSTPASLSLLKVSSLGWPYELPFSTLITAYCGITSRKNGYDVDVLEPWWPTLSTVDFKSAPLFNISSSSSLSASPVNKNDVFPYVIFNTIDVLFKSLPFSSTGPKNSTVLLPSWISSPTFGCLISTFCSSAFFLKFLYAFVFASVFGAYMLSAFVTDNAPDKPPTWSSWAWEHTT